MAIRFDGSIRLAAVMGVVVVGMLVGILAGHPSAARGAVPGNWITRALALTGSVRGPAGFPPTATLVTQLREADPTTDYVALRAPYERPALGATGVFASPTSVWFGRSTATGHIVELRQVTSGREVSIYGPQGLDAATVPDGTFDGPLAPAWAVQPGAVASISRDTTAYGKVPTSLRVTGTGQRGATSTTVIQGISLGTGTRSGSEFLIGMWARSWRLTRPISVELKLIYPGDRYAFFLGTAWADGVVVDGIPAGTSRWRPLTIRGVATRRVLAAQLFLVDSGTSPLRGSAWISRVTAQVS